MLTLKAGRQPQRRAGNPGRSVRRTSENATKVPLSKKCKLDIKRKHLRAAIPGCLAVNSYAVNLQLQIDGERLPDLYKCTIKKHVNNKTSCVSYRLQGTGIYNHLRGLYMRGFCCSEEPGIVVLVATRDAAPDLTYSGQSDGEDGYDGAGTQAGSLKEEPDSEQEGREQQQPQQRQRRQQRPRRQRKRRRDEDSDEDYADEGQYEEPDEEDEETDRAGPSGRARLAYHHGQHDFAAAGLQMHPALLHDHDQQQQQVMQHSHHDPFHHQAHLSHLGHPHQLQQHQQPQLHHHPQQPHHLQQQQHPHPHQQQHLQQQQQQQFYYAHQDRHAHLRSHPVQPGEVSPHCDSADTDIHARLHAHALSGGTVVATAALLCHETADDDDGVAGLDVAAVAEDVAAAVAEAERRASVAAAGPGPGPGCIGLPVNPLFDPVALGAVELRVGMGGVCGLVADGAALLSPVVGAGGSGGLLDLRTEAVGTVDSSAAVAHLHEGACGVAVEGDGELGLGSGGHGHAGDGGSLSSGYHVRDQLLEMPISLSPFSPRLIQELSGRPPASRTGGAQTGGQSSNPWGLDLEANFNIWPRQQLGWQDMGVGLL